MFGVNVRAVFGVNVTAIVEADNAVFKRKWRKWRTVVAVGEQRAAVQPARDGIFGIVRSRLASRGWNSRWPKWRRRQLELCGRGWHREVGLAGGRSGEGDNEGRVSAGEQRAVVKPARECISGRYLWTARIFNVISQSHF